MTDAAYHVRGLDPFTAEHGATPESEWIVKLDGESWSADMWVKRIERGTGFTTTHRHMVLEVMELLGLTRFDPEPGDPPNVVERWRLGGPPKRVEPWPYDPEPAHPYPPTVPGPPSNPPS